MKEELSYDAEEATDRILKRLWLTYYNDTLFEKGIITERERNKMRVRIKISTSIFYVDSMQS